MSKTPDTQTSDKKLSTVVTINGKQFDLKHMTTEKGLELHAELGNLNEKIDWQEFAKSFKAFLDDYSSVVAIKLKPGMNLSAASKELFEEIQKGGGKLLESTAIAKPYLKEMENIPGIRQMVGVARTSADAGNMMSEFMSGLTLDPRNFGKRFQDSLRAQGNELQNDFDAMLRNTSQEQRTAFSAAYAAAVHESQIKDPYKANFFDKIIAGAKLAFEWIGPGVKAGFKWVSSGFKKSYSECLDEVEVARGKELSKFSTVLEEHVAGKEGKAARPKAAQMLKDAETIAGIKTEEIADVIASKENLCRDKNGNVFSLTFDKEGNAVTKPLMKDGKQVNTSDAVTDKWNAALSIPYLVGVGFSADGLCGLTRGTMRHIVGANSSLAVKGNDLMTKSQTLFDDAVKAQNGTLPKKFMGFTTGGTHAPSQAMADKLTKEAIEAETKGQALLTRSQNRVDFFKSTKVGNWLLAQGEKQAPAGGLRIFNRMYATVGNVPGKVINNTVGMFETAGTRFVPGANTAGTVRNITVAIDGVQELQAIINGDTHGMLENGAQMTGGLTTAYFTNKAAQYLPGKLKLFAPLLTTAGFFGGREGGERIVDALSTSDAKATEQLNELTTQSTLNLQQLEQMQKDGKINFDDEAMKTVQKYTQEHKNTVIPGMNSSSVQTAR